MRPRSTGLVVWPARKASCMSHQLQFRFPRTWHGVRRMVAPAGWRRAAVKAPTPGLVVLRHRLQLAARAGSGRKFAVPWPTGSHGAICWSTSPTAHPSGVRELASFTRCKNQEADRDLRRQMLEPKTTKTARSRPKISARSCLASTTGRWGLTITKWPRGEEPANKNLRHKCGLTWMGSGQIEL